jgi:hypothetical protein
MAAAKTTGMLARKQTNKRKTTKIRAKNIANVCGHNRKETNLATVWVVRKHGKVDAIRFCENFIIII